MSKFTDSLGELRYSNGVVSFQLYHSDQPSSKLEIAMPFSEFQQIVGFLQSECHKILSTHSNWLSFERDRVKETAANTPQSEQQIQERVGPMIGSIS